MGYQLIETIEVGASPVSSVTFSAIPAEGVDLLLKMSVRSNRSNTVSGHGIRFNGDSTYGNYKFRVLQGTGSIVQAYSASAQSFIPCDIQPGGFATSNTFSNSTTLIANAFSSAKKNTSHQVGWSDNSSTGYNSLVDGQYNPTTAISSITVFDTDASFVQYSTFSLYSIS